MNGRGSKPPSFQTGMVESVTASCTTKSMPRSVIDLLDVPALLGVEGGAERGCADAAARQIVGEGRGDHHLVELADHLVADARVAEPPGRDVGNGELGAEQHRRQRRQEGQHRARFHQSGPQRVGDDHLAVAHRLHQAGDAQARTRIELQRIAEIGIEPAQQHLGPLQAGDRADEDAIVARGQILALDQQQAEIAREIGVLEVGSRSSARA